MALCDGLTSFLALLAEQSPATQVTTEARLSPSGMTEDQLTAFARHQMLPFPGMIAQIRLAIQIVGSQQEPSHKALAMQDPLEVLHKVPAMQDPLKALHRRLALKTLLKEEQMTAVL